MLFKLLLCLSFVLTNSMGDVMAQERRKGATLKPLSACCNIPELGDATPLAECSVTKLQGPCNDVQCIFEKSGFLNDKETLNEQAYKDHLRKWAGNHKGWLEAAEKAISDCVDRDIRQYLDIPCKAYDVFACTGIAMIKKCPRENWIC